MDRKRAPLLVMAVVVVVAVTALLLLTQESGRRTDRSAAPRAQGIGRDGGAGPGPDADGGMPLADAASLKALIERYGGFSSKGRVLLTLPTAPGAGLAVALRGTLDGLRVEAEAESDREGRFALPALPRTADYALTVEGPRVQPYALDGFAVDGAEHDFGDLVLDRYYFVEGRVTGEGGMGVKGASVALVVPMDTAGFSFLDSAKDAAATDAVVASTESNATGRFSLRLNKPGRFNLRALAEGYAAHYETGVIVDARKQGEESIELTRGDEIVGYVFDGTGRPVPDAAVALMVMRGMWSGAGKEVATTDGAGRFAFRVEPYSSRYMLRVVPPEGIDVIRVVDLPVRDDLIVRLPGTGVLTGKVVDAETQQPVAGAEVLIGIQASQGRNWMPDYSKPVLTDGYGVYRVSGVGKGQMHSLAVRAEGYEQATLSGMFPSDRDLWNRISRTALDAQTEVRLPDVPLRRGRVLTGHVLDKSTRKPVAGALVELRDFIMGNRATETDVAGGYRFDGVGSRVALNVSCEGYATFQDTPFQGWTLPEGEREVVRDVEIESGAVLEGRVESSDGDALPGALIRLETAETGRAAWTMRTVLARFYAYTDGQGRYRIEGVPPARLRVTAELSGFDRAKSKDRQVRAGETVSRLDIRMAGAARAEGTAVGRDGEPVEGARVTIARDPGPNASERDRWLAMGQGVSAFTDKRGAFSVRDVPTGDVLIRVEAQGFATTSVRRPGVKPGQTVTGLRLELPPAYTIRGKVVDPKGRPMTQCWIRATHTASPDGEPTTQLLGTRVDNDGTFLLRNLPPGTYALEVRLPRGMPGLPQYRDLKLEGIQAGAKDLELRLQLADG